MPNVPIIGTKDELPEDVVRRVIKKLTDMYPKQSAEETLAGLPKKERDAWLGSLSEEEHRYLEFDWLLKSRPKQRIDEYAKLHGISDWEVCLLIAGRGFGKAARYGTPVPTPSGWTSIEDLQVGSAVFDENGNRCTVTGVFPQGEKELLRVNFSDSTSV